MFAVSVVFDVAPSHAEGFLGRVKQQAKDSLEAEPDCHRFDVLVDPERPVRVFLYELYSNRAAFDQHLASAHFKAFDAEVAPMTLDKRVETWLLVGQGI